MGRAAPCPLLGCRNVAIPCFQSAVICLFNKIGENPTFLTLKNPCGFPWESSPAVSRNSKARECQSRENGIIPLAVPIPSPGPAKPFLESFIPNPSSQPAPSSRPPGIAWTLPSPAWDSFSRREFPPSLISRPVPALFFYSRSDSSSVFETRAWCYPGAGAGAGNSSSSFLLLLLLRGSKSPSRAGIPPFPAPLGGRIPWDVNPKGCSAGESAQTILGCSVLGSLCLPHPRPSALSREKGKGAGRREKGLGEGKRGWEKGRGAGGKTGKEKGKGARKRG